MHEYLSYTLSIVFTNYFTMLILRRFIGQVVRKVQLSAQHMHAYEMKFFANDNERSGVSFSCMVLVPCIH
jgi:hypothetical protein